MNRLLYFLVTKLERKRCWGHVFDSSHLLQMMLLFRCDSVHSRLSLEGSLPDPLHWAVQILEAGWTFYKITEVINNWVIVLHSGLVSFDTSLTFKEKAVFWNQLVGLGWLLCKERSDSYFNGIQHADYEVNLIQMVSFVLFYFWCFLFAH